MSGSLSFTGQQLQRQHCRATFIRFLGHDAPELNSQADCSEDAALAHTEHGGELASPTAYPCGNGACELKSRFVTGGARRDFLPGQCHDKLFARAVFADTLKRLGNVRSDTHCPKD
jgi:hypothetical protein